MEMVKFEDESSLARLYNAATWPGFYSSFLPPHHFTSQSQSQPLPLPLCQQHFFPSNPCLCASSFTSSQTSSLGYSGVLPPLTLSRLGIACADLDKITSHTTSSRVHRHQVFPAIIAAQTAFYTTHPRICLRPSSPPPTSTAVFTKLAPIKAEPLPFFTHNYLSRLPPSSLPSNNSCACCASYSPTSTQFPSPPISSTSDHQQEATSSSPDSASRKPPAAVVGGWVGASQKSPAADGAAPKSPAAEVGGWVGASRKSPAADGAARKSPDAVVGGSVGGLSRVLPAQTRAQKIRAVLDEYEITSPSLIQRLMPVPVAREEKRSFVRLLRLHGVSYADIKNLGELSTSLSTLRGWDRMKKPPSDRPRTPRWTAKDVKVMHLAVDAVVRTMEIGSPGFWRRVEQVMPRFGPSHPFSAQAIAAKYDNRSRGDIARLKANTMAQ
ncbi:uncharacterized protein FSUBG_480 [Fusarium subglutinans]|uniref:Uncharacterized protein n=1 Tax=Gibberella subglutinans TaxID=42677 RepID=A0A8H5QGU9_GIBSU|nr:uncharacterized protein FSUBG_480 [Fusarium subglutinans]KAF5613868.1 hypothetical protein FSUBG_480 [Fusarium subglutinans]